MLSASYANQEENRKMLLIILSSVRYLGRQGLAVHGWYKADDESPNRGELDSNFLQLLKIRAEDNPSIVQWIDRPQNKYTSPDIQNEMLSIMALSLLRDIAAEVSGKWFTIMVDEMTDLSNT